MLINSKEISSRIKLGSMLVILLIAAVLVLSLIFGWSPDHKLEYALAIIFVLFEIFKLIKNYTYIYYNSDGFKILFRYSSLGMLSAGNFSIEIPKKDLVSVSVEKSFLGLRKSIVFYVRTKQGTAKFKPVSLSVLSSKDIESMLADLNSLCQ